MDPHPADIGNMGHLPAVLLVALLAWFCFREHRCFRASLLMSRGDTEPHLSSADQRDTVQHRMDISEDPPVGPEVESAYRFPGVPHGWTLDRYACDGIQQIQIMLAQAARRRDAR